MDFLSENILITRSDVLRTCLLNKIFEYKCTCNRLCRTYVEPQSQWTIAFLKATDIFVFFKKFYIHIRRSCSCWKSTKGTFTELPESCPAFARCSLIILLLYNMSRENLSWSSQECELSIILRIFQKIQTTTTVAEKKNEFLFILVHVHTYVCTSTMYLLENVWNLVNCIHFYSYWSVYVDRL